jgi:hypothetical protein
MREEHRCFLAQLQKMLTESCDQAKSEVRRRDRNRKRPVHLLNGLPPS